MQFTVGGIECRVEPCTGAEDIANEVLDRTYDADVTAGRGRHAVHRQACERVRLQRFGCVISRGYGRHRTGVLFLNPRHGD
jgi:hypothetical protein